MIILSSVSIDELIIYLINLQSFIKMLPPVFLYSCYTTTTPIMVFITIIVLFVMNILIIIS